MAPNQFELFPPPDDAISALAFAPDNSRRLVVSSWDKYVHVYEIVEDGQAGALVRKIEHPAPVLDVCFGGNQDEAFSACMDWTVKRIDLTSCLTTVLSKHEAPVRSIVHSNQHSLLISASWDLTLRLHNTASPTSLPVTIPLPSKPHALAISPSKLVVAMAGRLVHLYQLSALTSALTSLSDLSLLQPWQQRESSLKFLTRSVACMPSDDGYAVGSIEGRVAVEWFEDSPETQARKYAFKCHRQHVDDADVVYPVHALAFHPRWNTFASGGGDGTAALWDSDAKRRMRQYAHLGEEAPNKSVAALSFSRDAKYLAFGVCPGFETGMEDYSGQGQTHVIVRELGETEARPKNQKS